jgi:ribonucleoside-diphosphate reductase alpha chain
MTMHDADIKGPRTAAADKLHAMKYRGRGEDFREAMNRVAFGLKDSDPHYKVLREILLDQRFLPAGRIQSAIGATRKVTPYNCFVSGTIEDSYVDGPGSIMGRVHEAAATMRQGGGIGYDFSTLRPRGFQVVQLESQATGPVSFMEIFNAVCLCTASSGHRRGAQMGVLRVDHPDIEEFIRAKQNEGHLKGFNVSIAITDEFMQAVEAGTEFKLQWKNAGERMVDARELWEKIMRSTWDWAEPGVLFIDRVNEMNNLYYCETIAATNPCGEQPLPPYGACLLGSFNLPKYLKRVPDTGTWEFDSGQLIDDIPAVVRAMDNVVDRARYPLPQQKAEAITKRRMGLGVTGLSNAAEACGHAYGSPGFLQFEATILKAIRDETYRASAMLAKEKEPFALFDKEKYLTGKFIQTLPDDIRALIAEHGIRNSHLTSIAPTGTISMCADNVSSGIEPVFGYGTSRKINTPDGPIEEGLVDYGVSVLGVKGRLAAQVTASEHVAVLTTAQRYVDSAVSKTCNVTGDMPWEDFKGIYMAAWKGGAKGCTTFNSSGKRAGIMETGEEGESCRIDLETGLKDCG